MKSTPAQENRRWHLRQLIRAMGTNAKVALMLNDVSTSYITIVAGKKPSRNIGDAMKIAAGLTIIADRIRCAFEPPKAGLIH